MYWARIKGTDEDDVKAWLSSVIFPQYDAMALFRVDEHVTCVYVKKKQEVIRVEDIRPVQNALTCFYTRDDKKNFLIIYGILDYWTLRNGLRGVVNVVTDLQNCNEECVKRSVPCGPCLVLAEETKPPEPEHFYFYGGEAHEALLRHSVTRDALHTKVVWILRTWCKQESPPPLKLNSVDDVSTSLLCIYMGDFIEAAWMQMKQLGDTRLHRTRWDSMRLAAEETLFLQRMSGFADCDYFSLLKLLHFNSYLSDYVDDHLIEPTALDEQCFYDMYHTQEALPEVFLDVPAIELPEEMSKCMPKYRGGRVHLPIHWRALHQWIWHRYVQNCARRVTLFRPKNVSVNSLQLRSWIQAESIFVCRFMYLTQDKWYYNLSSTTTTTKRHKKEHVKIEGGEDTTFVASKDWDEFWNRMPACLKRIALELKRFPRYHERFRITQILVRAGYAEDFIVWLFETWNRKFPKTPFQKLELRYNPVPDIRAFQKENDDVHWCGNIIHDTLKKHNLEHLMCPFAMGKTGVVRDIEDVCYSACNENVPFGKRPDGYIRKKLIV
jgi:hypothetical protein